MHFEEVARDDGEILPRLGIGRQGMACCLDILGVYLNPYDRSRIGKKLPCLARNDPLPQVGSRMLEGFNPRRVRRSQICRPSCRGVWKSPYSVLRVSGHFLTRFLSEAMDSCHMACFLNHPCVLESPL
jgi:hypothetical protein